MPLTAAIPGVNIDLTSVTHRSVELLLFLRECLGKKLIGIFERKTNEPAALQLVTLDCNEFVFVAKIHPRG